MRCKLSACPAGEINRLHSEIVADAQSSLTKSIRVGELLADVKSQLDHGAWLPWISKNLDMCERTAQRYIKVWEHRKNDNVSYLNLSKVYAALTNGKPEKPTTEPPPAAPDCPPTAADAQETIAPDDSKLRALDEFGKDTGGIKTADQERAEVDAGLDALARQKSEKDAHVRAESAREHEPVYASTYEEYDFEEEIYKPFWERTVAFIRAHPNEKPAVLASMRAMVANLKTL